LLLVVAGVAAGLAAVVVAAGAVEDPGAGLSVASAAVFFDRDFFAAVAESVAAGVADESAAAAFVDFVFFVVLVESGALSVVPALESVAVFFLDLLFVVPLAEESEAAALESESAVVAFFVFFFGVLVPLSALESLDASCARSSVVNRNKPISAAIATIKTFIRRFRSIVILRVKT
jgi:hypothetical protein